MKKTIKIILGFVLGFLCAPLFAGAATVTFGNPSNIAYNSTVTVTSNKNIYAPGEAIILNWSIHPGYSGSQYFYFLTAKIGSVTTGLQTDWNSRGGGGLSGVGTVYAPSALGSYTIFFSENLQTGFSPIFWNYGSMSFSVAPASPCALPWGGSIPSGSSVTAYQSSSAVSPSVCAPQTRTCTNGSLSGTYTNQACSVSVALTATITAPATNITIPQNTGYSFSGQWTGNANYEYWHYGFCRIGVAMGGGSNLAVPITPQTSTMSYFFNIPGTYIVYFGVADTNGNASTCDSRTITVTPAGPPSATLSANPTNCTIAPSASTCTVPFTWNIVNSGNPSLYNFTRSSVYTTAPSRVNQPYPIINGVNEIGAMNGGALLARVLVNASCALGTIWNGTLCSALSARIDLPDESTNPLTVIQGSTDIGFLGSGTTDSIPAGLGYSYFVGPGTSPNALAVDTEGNIYTSNGGTNTISKIAPNGFITRSFATVGQSPNALTFDRVGNLYTANFTANTVSKVTPGGIVNTFATVGTNPYGLTFDPAGNLYTANFGSNNISKVTPSGVVNTFVTMPPASGPHAIAADSFGNIFVTNHFKATVSKIDPTGIIVATYPVGNNPSALVFDPAGNLYVGPSMGGGIRKITPAGVVSSVGPAGISGDGLTFDSLGNLYAADAGAGYLYKITPGGVLTIHGPLWIPSLKGALYNPLTGGVYTTQPSNGLVKKLTTGINPITEYRWSEGTCGGSVLQSNSSFAFNMPTPTPASRTVFLRIKDSQGQWSTNCPSRTINITPPPVNGACGSSGPFSLAPTTGLCTAGTPSAVPTGSGPWFWDCNGSNGGTNATCSALSAVVPGTCGPSATETNVKPTTGLCNYTATTPTVLGSRPWTWKCTDSAGFGFASCTTTTKCGDGVCQKGTETFLNCPKDCKQKFQQF